MSIMSVESFMLQKCCLLLQFQTPARAAIASIDQFGGEITFTPSLADTLRAMQYSAVHEYSATEDARYASRSL